MMKKILLFFCIFTPLLHATTPLEASIADTLASYRFIVNNSQNPAQYRLAESITRAEAIGVALKVGDIDLPEKYFCKNYYRDVAYNPLNNWICRAIEIASDSGIITRENSTARPNTPISRIEALAITMRAGRLPYSRNVSRVNYPQDTPQWQIDILEGALLHGIISSTKNFGPDMFATRIDMFGMIYNMRFSGMKTGYITDITPTLPPLGSAPDGAGIVITLPGAPTSGHIPVVSVPPLSPVSPLPVPSTVQKTALAGFGVTVPKDVKINTPFDLKVQALDRTGKIITDYTGTVYFDLIVGAYDDMSPITIDDGYVFSPADGGVLVLKNVVIKKAGTYELDVYEIASGTDVVKSFTITTSTAAPAASTSTSTKIAAILVTAPKNIPTNTAFDMTVSLLNEIGQVISGSLNTVYFTTNNTAADVIFPNKSYTFTAADAGKKVFSGFKLKQAGDYELTVYEVDMIPNGTTQTVKITATPPN